VRAAEAGNGFFHRPVRGVAEIARAVVGVFSDRFAPRVACLIGESVGKPLRHLKDEGVVSRVAAVGIQGDVRKLRILDEVVFGQLGISQNAAVFIGECVRCVEEIRERADSTVRYARPRCRKCPKRRRSCPGHAIHNAIAGDIQSQQHLIKQSGVAAGLGQLEGVQECLVGGSLPLIQRNRIIEFRAFAADIANL
jgi:hypothetical protein